MKTIKPQGGYNQKKIIIGSILISLPLIIAHFATYVVTDQPTIPEQIKEKYKPTINLDIYRHDAAVQAEQHIKTYLKYPDEAKFGFSPGAGKYLGGNEYEIVDSVVTVNDLGVRSTYQYHCKFELLETTGPTTANFKLTYLRLGEMEFVK